MDLTRFRANWTTIAQRCMVLSRFRGECQALTSQVRYSKQETTTDQASIPIPALRPWRG